jgi:hypothetical protein
MTVSEWLETNRHRLHGEGDEWVTKRVAVLEVPGRTLTLGLEPVLLDSQEPVLSSCLVELGVEAGKPVLSRVIEDPPARDLETRKADARKLIA